MNGKAMKRIKEIEASKDFKYKPVLPGAHEFVAKLTDYEMAVFTHAIEVSKNGSLGKSQAEVIIKRMWFEIFDRLDLWDKPEAYGINKGESLVILDPSFVLNYTSNMRETRKNNEITVDSFDDLPEPIKQVLSNVVVSSLHYKSGGFGNSVN